jgi:catechol 2,3-dioxygenase-like lactoylglutathione lyase family enzyme
MSVNGIHHVTAISGPARRNVDLYTKVLGLRRVKRTFRPFAMGHKRRWSLPSFTGQLVSNADPLKAQTP